MGKTERAKGKKDPVSWKAKYQGRAMDIARSIKERDAALVRTTELEEIFKSLAEFGCEPLEMISSHKMAIDALKSEKDKLECDRSIILETASSKAIDIIEESDKKASELYRNTEREAAAIKKAATEMGASANRNLRETEQAKRDIEDKIAQGVKDATKHLEEREEAIKHLDAKLNEVNQRSVALGVFENTLRKKEIYLISK